MSRKSNPAILLIVALVVLLVALGAWIWHAMGTGSKDSANAAKPTSATDPIPMSGVKGKLPPWRRADGSAPVRPQPAPSADEPLPPDIPEMTPQESEEMSRLIGDTKSSDAAVTASLLTILTDPKRSVAMRMEAMTHAANLLPPEELERLKPLLEDKTTPLPIVEKIMVEITNNPSDKLSLEMGLAVLEGPHESVRQQAHDLVAFHLDVDPDVDSKVLAEEARRQLAAGKFNEPAPAPEQGQGQGTGQTPPPGP